MERGSRKLASNSQISEPQIVKFEDTNYLGASRGLSSHSFIFQLLPESCPPSYIIAQPQSILFSLPAPPRSFMTAPKRSGRKTKSQTSLQLRAVRLHPYSPPVVFFKKKITNYRPLNLVANALVLPSIFLSRLLFYLLHQCVQPFIWFYLQLICTCL